MSPNQPPFPLDALLEESTWLQGIARALTDQNADREDLVQDTWLSALKGQAGKVEHPKGWLATVTRRTAGIRRRHVRRRMDHESLAARPHDDDSAGPIDPQVSLERLELAGILATELSRLAEPFRGALYLRYYEGLTPAAIAAQSGTSPSTIRGRLHRGRALLREALVARDGRSWESWAALLTSIAGAPGLAANVSGGTALATIMTMRWTALSALAGVLAAGGTWWAESRSVETPAESLTEEWSPRGEPDPGPPAATLQSVPAESAQRESSSASARASTTSPPDPTFGVIGRGVIVDEAGGAIEGATVRIRMEGRGSVAAETGPSGGWSALDLHPGPAVLEVSAPGFLSATSSEVIGDGPGWNPSIVLSRAAILPVRFEDPDGNAVPMARFNSALGSSLGVAVTHEPPGVRISTGGRHLRRSEGATFESRAEDELPPDWGPRYQGRLLLSAAPPLWVSLTYREAVVETRRLVGSESELVFVVGDLKPFSGTVLLRAMDAATGEAIVTGMSVTHPSGGRSIEPRSVDGQLIFESIPPGRIRVKYSGGIRWLEFDEDLRVGPGETLDLGLVSLPQGGR